MSAHSARGRSFRSNRARTAARGQDGLTVVLDSIQRTIGGAEHIAKQGKSVRKVNRDGMHQEVAARN